MSPEHPDQKNVEEPEDDFEPSPTVGQLYARNPQKAWYIAMAGLMIAIAAFVCLMVFTLIWIVWLVVVLILLWAIGIMVVVIIGWLGRKNTGESPGY